MPTITLTLDDADADMLVDLIARGCEDLTHAHATTWLQRQQAHRVAGTALEAVNRALQTKAETLAVTNPNAIIVSPDQPDGFPARIGNHDLSGKADIVWVEDNVVRFGYVLFQHSHYSAERECYQVNASDIEVLGVGR
jgi:hypothetical protein